MDIHAITSQEVLERISRHCPSALSTYLTVLHHVDQFGKAKFTRKQIEYDLSETWTKFKNNLKKLALENLIEWHPVEHGLVVIMADADEDE